MGVQQLTEGDVTERTTANRRGGAERMTANRRGGAERTTANRRGGAERTTANRREGEGEGQSTQQPAEEEGRGRGRAHNTWVVVGEEEGCLPKTHAQISSTSRRYPFTICSKWPFPFFLTPPPSHDD